MGVGPENLTPLVAAEAALAVIQPVLRGLTQEDRVKPTPCADFTAHELAEHLLGSLVQLGGMAGPTLTIPCRRIAGGQGLGARWPGDRRVALGGSRRHWPGPRDSQVPPCSLASILPLELLLHGWDLAQASGQQLRVSDEVVPTFHELTRGVIAQGRGSSFADEITPAADADALDRFAPTRGRTAIPPDGSSDQCPNHRTGDQP